MAYIRKTWGMGDKPTAAALNNLETGVQESDAKASSNASALAAQDADITQKNANLSTAQTSALALQTAANAGITQIESSQNLCFARAASTGIGTLFTGYTIGYQRYTPLFSVDSDTGLTCLVAGTYLLICDAFLTNTDAVLRWLKNGALISEIARMYTNKTSPIGQRVCGYALATLAVGDVITFGITRSLSNENTCEDLNANLFRIA
jgi:hypothetical protein